MTPQEKWENWERQRLYMEVASESELLRIPQGPPVANSRWTEVPVLGAAWRPVLGRIEWLWQALAFHRDGGTDYFHHRLAPL